MVQVAVKNCNVYMLWHSDNIEIMNGYPIVSGIYFTVESEIKKDTN